MAGAADGGVGFEVQTNLRQVLAQLKEFEPKLATAVRRDLRHSADEAIAGMKQILDDAPTGVVTGKTHAMGTDRLGRKRLRVASLTVSDANRARSVGAREAIKKGLKVQVSTGKRSTTIRLTTGGSAALRKAMNRKSWRHQVFNDPETYVEQPGSQYFNRGIHGQVDAMRKNVQDAITVALDALELHTPHLD